jgi:release factor glutamine methyltransferase
VTGPASPRLGALILHARRRLEQTGSESAALDAELLAAHSLAASRTEVLAHPERVLTGDEARRLEALVARREAHEPLAYLLGEREFYGRSFKVDGRALIPRPESELLVEQALVWLREQPGRPLVVDVGTGSGCLAISLALETEATVVGVDSSTAALSLARENAARLKVPSERLLLVQASLLSWVRAERRPDLVVANLPYVPSEVLPELPLDVRLYEPLEALDGGPGGTRLIVELLQQCAVLDVPRILAELDSRHAESVLEAARSLLPWATARLKPDLAGRWRVLAVESQAVAGV